MKQKHPIQPIEWDKSGVVRFKRNDIVRFLLDAGPFDMNQLACMNFTKDDRWQFAQLIGYSVSGIGDLGYHDRKALAIVDEQVAQEYEERNKK
jgi:hypothetical protein